jgi:hypothetical protein
MLFAENAVLGIMLLDQRAYRGLGPPVAFRYRVKAADLLVDDSGTASKARQGFLAGSIREEIEEGAIGEHGTSIGRQEQ